MVKVSDVEVKMNTLLDEANANFEASRFKDAARTFEHLVSLAIQNNDPEEAIYYAYRAAYSWKMDKNKTNRINSFKLIGELSFSVASVLAEDVAIHTQDLEEKAKSLATAGQCLFFKERERGKQLLLKALDIYQKLLDKETINKEKLKHLVNRRSILQFMEENESIIATELEMAAVYETSAESQLAEKQPKAMQQALREYEDALKIYEKLKKKTKVTELKRNITKLSNELSEYDPFSS